MLIFKICSNIFVNNIVVWTQIFVRKKCLRFFKSVQNDLFLEGNCALNCQVLKNFLDLRAYVSSWLKTKNKRKKCSSFVEKWPEWLGFTKEPWPEMTTFEELSELFCLLIWLFFCCFARKKSRRLWGKAILRSDFGEKMSWICWEYQLKVFSIRSWSPRLERRSAQFAEEVFWHSQGKVAELTRRY